jgi:type IV secretory pathway VirB2 component (pilin)
MSKKITKILSILMVALLMLGMTITPVFASATLDWDDVTIQSNTTSTTATAASNITGQILGVVQVIGVAVAVIMLIVLAIKYISAAPNDKAEIKKHAVVYVVGAVVLFAASGIIGIIRGFAEQIQ